MKTMLQKSPLFTSGSKTKNAVVSILSQNMDLTAQQLYRMVTKENQKTISYQALHKAVRELEQESVLERHNNQYRLSSHWLQNVEQWVQKAKNQASGKEKPQKPEIRVFPNIIETGRFLIFDFFHYPNPENKTSVCVWKRMYSLMGLSKEEIEGVRDTMGKNHFHVASESNTSVDQFIAEAFEQMGGKVKLGIPNPEDFDAIVVGDYVGEIYYDASHKKRWKKLWETPKTVNELNLEQTLETMHHPYTTKMIIYYDPIRAQKIGEQVLKLF